LEEKKIYIINSPLDIAKSTINLNNANIKKIIKLPKVFNDVQLFVKQNRLIILATRYVSFYQRE
jgi:hypothetical protein